VPGSREETSLRPAIGLSLALDRSRPGRARTGLPFLGRADSPAPKRAAPRRLRPLVDDLAADPPSNPNCRRRRDLPGDAIEQPRMYRASRTPGFAARGRRRWRARRGDRTLRPPIVRSAVACRDLALHSPRTAGSLFAGGRLHGDPNARRPHPSFRAANGGRPSSKVGPSCAARMDFHARRSKRRRMSYRRRPSRDRPSGSH
jgi:hypothetical protein